MCWLVRPSQPSHRDESAGGDYAHPQILLSAYRYMTVLCIPAPKKDPGRGWLRHAYQPPITLEWGDGGEGEGVTKFAERS